MTNLEATPQEAEIGIDAPCSELMEIVTSRDVPLGGIRAMTVRRTIPHRSRSMVGAWCFADHYGPDDVTAGAGMQVAPHPHTALQTVTWLFAGEIEHRDSLGTVQTVRPGELNLMTAGHGISHSEGSTPERPPALHGVQLWTALPADSGGVAPHFEHLGKDVLPRFGRGDAQITLLAGEMFGYRAPTKTYSPLMGAEIVLPSGGEVRLELNPQFEYGVLADTAGIQVHGAHLERSQLAYMPPGQSTVTFSSPAPGRFMLLGGEPFNEDIVMWWNFIGRSHDEVVAARDEWMAAVNQYGADGQPLTGVDPTRFGLVHGYPDGPIPAPPLPQVRLRTRGNLKRDT